jgi:hypothetical protein
MDNAHRALPRCSSLMTMTLCMRSIQILMEFSQLSQLRVNRYRNGLSAICPIYPIATEERSSRDLSQERTCTY